jgi:hypothetical protein
METLIVLILILLFPYLGPCSMNEVYFPQTENETRGLGSCYYIQHNGKARFDEVNNICLDSSNRSHYTSSIHNIMHII